MNKITTLAAAAALLALTSTSYAATYTWDGSTDGNWDTAENWVGDTKPVSGTDADVVISGDASPDQFIRNHRTLRSFTFGADNDVATNLSLESHANANRDLRMDGGAGNASITVAAGSDGDKTIGITTGGQGEIEMFTDLDITHNGNGVFRIRSEIRDDATANNLSIAGAGEYLILGVSTYLGNTTITGTDVNYANNSGQAFSIGANGVNNAVLGTGTVEFKSDFTFDLTGASTGLGDSWTIVYTGTLTESFHSQFSVVGFTQLSDVWSGTANGADYEFSELTGVLTVVPEPGTYALLAGLTGLVYVMLRLRRA